MKCSSCNITVNTNEDKCPICNNPLKGKKSSPFPSKVKKRSDEFTLKLLGFLSIVIALITVFIDYKNNNQITFSKYTIVGIFYIYSLVYITLYNRDVFKIIYKYSFSTMLFSLIIYYMTKLTIIVTILIPSIIIINIIFSFLLSLIIKKKYIIRYLNITLIMIVLSIILYIIYNKVFNFRIMMYISTLTSIIDLIYLLMFNFYEVKEKVKRFFNI